MDSLHCSLHFTELLNVRWCPRVCGVDTTLAAALSLRLEDYALAATLEAEQFAHQAVQLRYISQKARTHRTLLSIQTVCIELNVKAGATSFYSTRQRGFVAATDSLQNSSLPAGKRICQNPCISLYFLLTNCAIRVSTNSPFGRPLKARNPGDLSLL